MKFNYEVLAFWVGYVAFICICIYETLCAVKDLR